jgi:predicted transport protein
MYIAYKISQNIACLEFTKTRLVVYLKLKVKDFKNVPENVRDVTNIGHYGTGDLEVSIKNISDFENTKYLFEKAYQKVGG